MKFAKIHIMIDEKFTLKTDGIRNYSARSQDLIIMITYTHAIKVKFGSFNHYFFNLKTHLFVKCQLWYWFFVDVFTKVLKHQEPFKQKQLKTDARALPYMDNEKYPQNHRNCLTTAIFPLTPKGGRRLSK